MRKLLALVCVIGLSACVSMAPRDRIGAAADLLDALVGEVNDAYCVDLAPCTPAISAEDHRSALVQLRSANTALQAANDALDDDMAQGFVAEAMIAMSMARSLIGEEE